MAIPVLTYHSNNVLDNSYQGNDHQALADDLRALHFGGWRIISLDALLDWYEGGPRPADDAPCCAITFDDGSDFDFRDLDHPSCGLQRSFFNILRDFHEQTGAQAHASSFVIASPRARRQLDQRCLVGRDWWGDGWWRAANDSGLLAIESHGWDHLHPELTDVRQRQGQAGDFQRINSFPDCESQLRDAALEIERLAGRAPRYFAYPWGQFGSYLVAEYLPRYRERHGYRAAFTTRPEPVQRSHDRWLLPRYVCGDHWQSSRQLLAMLGEPGSVAQ